MSRVVAAARSWIGTAYLHQGSSKAVGTDCLGLVRGVWRAVYGGEPEVVPAYTADWSEPQHEERLWEAALRHLTPVPPNRALSDGECLLFRMRDGSVAKHLGILSRSGETPAFIHAYSGHGVVESALSKPWARRIAARFDFPATAEPED
ncbi:NlpC/P60 family protein [Jannaschia sp. M317]|uniref:NlpC/P60 family protein n=1 Tax=Jannaschia sp. M317 TaxID=2867011 RepID=UPI0021A84E6E|nr:NlpC/P60 family protein [Jannaschia sp. M317]UWQ16982.1 C40 family peptidase [Jannaschia sp. M317]